MQRISREAPEEVAGPLMRLQEFKLVSVGVNNEEKDKNRPLKPQNQYCEVVILVLRNYFTRCQLSSSRVITQ